MNHEDKVRFFVGMLILSAISYIVVSAIYILISNTI